MAYTTIDDPSVYFQTVIYTGNESGQSITNDGNSDLRPDLVWIKNRGDAHGHQWQDSTRGVGKALESNNTDSEAQQGTAPDDFTAFNSDGFTLGGGHQKYNDQDDTYVAWQWKANGGSRTTFTESGDNPGGGYQANTTAGFSIIDYTGTGQTAGDPALVPHGLGVAPSFIIVKQRDATRDWNVFHHKNTSAPETDFLVLNSTDATADASNRWNDTMPNATNVVLGDTSRVNNDTGSYIMYAFTEKQGYSKFGSYTGNGHATDGPFVYLGFKPAWLFYRNVSRSENWLIEDNKRNPFNRVAGAKLQANVSDAETTETRWGFDFLSNGFKVRQTSAQNANNGNGETIIYMAFAESPFVSSEGVPTTAR